MNSEHQIVVSVSYFLMTVPFGLTTGPFIAKYTGLDLVRIFFVAAAMLAVLAMVGALWPNRLKHWSIYPLGWIIVVFIGIFSAPHLTKNDWCGIGLLVSYLLYDLRRATVIERTAANALACAVGVYLDVVAVAFAVPSSLFQTVQRRFAAARVRT